MEISRVNRGSSVKQEKVVNNSKKDFSQSFSFARERKNEQQLKEMLDDIRKKGSRLAITKSFADVRAYKRLIKDYLQQVMDYMYEIKKDISFWQTQYFITVDIIDAKLQELTELLMNQEGENINVAARVDEIQGLILDIYK
ncbi:YaaR family protein [Clostridium cellulovorans]|uniref:DUF327 domain-containing protein n=1 Tax=Clostridium cellulovorans (strain ATCC 35296 / DSM 3052 / OCM 3 / 743B) TaxID=573061 RepID=D9SWY4_CLOC7|nr:YaaR family protein [Clostridium cellulovorans]ADL51345.1 protein of unknown function DUF327 [Clostridium cellulovorans 743B]